MPNMHLDIFKRQTHHMKTTDGKFAVGLNMIYLVLLHIPSDIDVELWLWFSIVHWALTETHKPRLGGLHIYSLQILKLSCLCNQMINLMENSQFKPVKYLF
jgi:hypothetical protein